VHSRQKWSLKYVMDEGQSCRQSVGKMKLIETPESVQLCPSLVTFITPAENHTYSSVWFLFLWKATDTL
jgi:hypothetical protein